MAKEKKAYLRVETEDIGEFTFGIISGKGFKAYEENDFLSYKVTLEITKSEAKRLKKIIQDFWDENKPENGKTKPANFDSLVYYNEKTENYSISPHARVRFDGQDEDNVIGIVDIDGEKLDPKVFGSIGKGSTGWVSFNLTTYAKGVSMYLNAVQLDEFVPYSGGGDGSGNFSKKSGNKLGDGKSMGKKNKKKKKNK